MEEIDRIIQDGYSYIIINYIQKFFNNLNSEKSKIQNETIAQNSIDNHQ